jgi:hypothetical protein
VALSIAIDTAQFVLRRGVESGRKNSATLATTHEGNKKADVMEKSFSTTSAYYSMSRP